MNWSELNQIDQIQKIKEDSKQHPILIFKHSTSCMISAMALNRLERKWKTDSIQAYFLDLIANRDVSNRVAEEFGVMHQSPQAILVSNEEVVYHSSHNGIDFNDIVDVANRTEQV